MSQRKDSRLGTPDTHDMEKLQHTHKPDKKNNIK